jgi:glycogen debranching enzyme
MTRLLNSADGIYEIYNPYDGSVDGGWQIGGDDLQGHLWDSCPDQTWSATSYIGAVLQGIFGIRMEEDGIRFAPCVPAFLKDSSVRCLVIWGKKFHVTLSGFGTEVAEMTVNGKTVDTARLSYADAEENNEIVLTLK